MPKNVKGGTLWALLTYILLQNIKKLERGTKKFEKSRTVPKKIERGDPLVSSGFVKKRLKMKGGTLCTKFALAGLGLRSFISFCKKWYIRDEVCGLTKQKRKKTSHCKSRALFTRKAPTIKVQVVNITACEDR